MSSNFINLECTQQFFGMHTEHVSVILHRFPDARLIWLNHRVMHLDPQFNSVQNSEQYKQHLLKQCTYAMPDKTTTISHVSESITAVSDRYGGEGIGSNGGSGRACYVNGYHIKGIGRTPLVSPLTDKAHASGGAYLEECAREAVLSEIVDAEFPHGSVPVLAIIDTGFVQIWDTDNGPKMERRCLLVRPAFLRPAHFMRALDYIGHHHHDGMKDAQRVALMMKQACTQFGSDQFSGQWESFWSTWAEQLAYAFVHRLNHGGNSESNIALDGRLLDFGGMSALPSWARILLTQGGWPAGADMHYLFHAQQSASAMLGKHLGQEWMLAEKWQSLQAAAFAAYKKTVLCEVLRVSGLTRVQIKHLLTSDMAQAITAAVNRLLAHYTREQFSIFEGMPEPHFAWEIPKFWEANVPQHLKELRELIERATSQGILTDTTGHLHTTWMGRCQMLSQTRTGLFRDNIKRDLYKELDGTYTGDTLTEDAVTRVIEKFIRRHRIDSKMEPLNAVPIGFASNNGHSYALFKDLIGNSLFALQEQHADYSEVKIPIQKMDHEKIVLADIAETEIAVHVRCNETEWNTLSQQRVV